MKNPKTRQDPHPRETAVEGFVGNKSVVLTSSEELTIPGSRGSSQKPLRHTMIFVKSTPLVIISYKFARHASLVYTKIFDPDGVVLGPGAYAFQSQSA